MSGIACAVIGAAIIGAGVAIYTTSNQPRIPAPPPPASYYSYDDEGNPSGEQVWDASRNAYVYKPAPLTEAQKAEKAQRDELRANLLGNLANTPEDRIAAYEQYAQAFSDQMHTDVDKRYEKLKTSQEEALFAKGMGGSKAYADTMAELNSDKMAMDTDIAQKALLAKEELANVDRNYWLNTLSTLDQSKNADAALALNSQQAGLQSALAGSSTQAAQYQLNSSNKLRAWEAQVASNSELSKNISSTATGLAFLYGYKSPGSTSPLKAANPMGNMG
jgi:hypothetical protein